MELHDPNLLSKARADVIKLPKYDAGISIDTLLISDIKDTFINLAVNENPFGMSPLAQEALIQAIKNGALYPDSNCLALRKRLSEKLDVPHEIIIAGNGSEDILALICKAFISSGDTVLIPKPTFSLHHIYANMMGANVIEIAIDDMLTFNSSAWLNKVKSTPRIKMLMLSNPSNPVGCTLTHNQLKEIIDCCPSETILVIDEAYVEFAEKEPEFPNSLSILQRQNRPWILLRTFSKAYGLAGMRVGYGICSSKTFVEILDRVRTPYNVNRLAQAAAVGAIEDTAHLEKTVNFVIEEREKMRYKISELGLKIAPSSSNFLFVDTQQNSTKIAEILLKSRILIKPWKEDGYSSFIRVSIGREMQNINFVGKLESALSTIKNNQ